MNIHRPGLYKLANGRVGAVTSITKEKAIGHIWGIKSGAELLFWKFDGQPVHGAPEWSIVSELPSYDPNIS